MFNLKLIDQRMHLAPTLPVATPSVWLRGDEETSGPAVLTVGNIIAQSGFTFAALSPPNIGSSTIQAAQGYCLTEQDVTIPAENINGVWTAECWARKDSSQSEQNIFVVGVKTASDGYGSARLAFSGSGFKLLASATGSGWGINTTFGSGVSLSTMYHVAVCKNSDNRLRVWINGNLSLTTNALTHTARTNRILLGAVPTSGGSYSGTNRLIGRIENFKFIEGVEKYTAAAGNFTPSLSYE